MKILSTVVFTLASSLATLTYAGIDNLNAIEEALNAESSTQLEHLSESLEGYDSWVAKYRLATRYQVDQNGSNAKKVLNSLVQELETAIAQKQDPEVSALLANIYGFSISVSPALAMDYGPKAQRTIQKAYAVAPDNPRVMLFKASFDYNTPAMFGGDKIRAQQILTKAVKVYEKDAGTDRYWGHADAYILLGLTFLEQGQIIKAREYWLQALSISPNSGWAGFLLESHQPI